MNKLSTIGIMTDVTLPAITRDASVSAPACFPEAATRTMTSGPDDVRCAERGTP